MDPSRPLDELTRRDTLIAAAGTAALGCTDTKQRTSAPADVVLHAEPLGMPWRTVDPFLFCVHHDDAYPKANGALGPAAALDGRELGSDFAGKDGWRMYHGLRVPGFPQHPHRGFETVTVVRRGLVDHSDSLGATARYGQGDVQWLTAGRGILHAEMFPLLSEQQDNPLELFQIWLNLPKVDKFAAPHFSMLWSPTVPKLEQKDAAGREVKLTVVAGSLFGVTPPAPPPKSWASRPDAQVAIATIALAPGAQLTLPPAPGTNRSLYFFRGQQLQLGTRSVERGHSFQVRTDVPTTLTNGDAPAELLVLQGRPIGEPVVHHGPFVMNSREEIAQTIQDYRLTGFGGWPWHDTEPVHAADKPRFARHADGREEGPA